MTIAAQSARSRLDNFAHAERFDHTSNAHEAVRTLLRSWLAPRLSQRQAPREQCSASAKEFEELKEINPTTEFTITKSCS